MKSKYIVFFYLFLSYGSFYAQKHNPIFFLEVSEAWMGSENITPQAITGNQRLIIYTDNNSGVLGLTNAIVTDNTMSYGAINSVNTKSFLNQQNGYYQKEYDFNWQYQNTYNDNTGLAQVNFKIIELVDGKDFFGEITIQDGNGLFLRYKGPIILQRDILVLDYLVEKLK